MISFDELTRVGFGSYRVTVDSAQHYQALHYALSSGCNLIDTAPNYMHGRSELLIGAVLRENPELDGFIVTKAGYVEEEDSRCAETVMLSSGVVHSIHPDFLKARIERSLYRLGRSTLDGFLLHNPEYYLEQEDRRTSEEELYDRIGRAFALLEDEVAAGRVRYYGVSSNTLPFGPEHPRRLLFPRLLDVAAKVSHANHFRIVQFPLNLLETGAFERHGENPSVIELARQKGIVTLGNRPLYAKTPAGVALLATRSVNLDLTDSERLEELLQVALEVLERRLRTLGFREDDRVSSALNIWRRGCSLMETPEAVDRLFASILEPLVQTLYRGAVPQEDQVLFAELHRRARARAVSRMNEQALLVRAELEGRGTIRNDDPRPLAAIACEGCLDLGVDHVLVGMRRRGYVDDFKPLFHRARSVNVVSKGGYREGREAIQSQR
jgi:aryl-alcohol dehydrogenase-like predicted oxidoreductase